MAAGDAELRHIEEGELDELIQVQNAIFADYIVPMRSTKEFFLDFLRSVGGEASNVLVATDKGRIVGYANPVVDGPEAWIGGVGVVPSHRGAGLGRRLMLAAEEFCADKGAEEAILEVIEGNERAARLYRGMGYSEVRRYVCAEGRPMQFAGYGRAPRRVSAEEVVPMHAATYQDSCWQRRKAQGLLNSARSAECYATDGGFVVVRRAEASGFIPYLGILPETRGRGLGTSLAKFALNRLWELGAFKVGMYNLNEEPAVLRMLDKFDFPVTMKQVEMRKRLR